APDGDHAVSARFAEAHGVALRFYAPGVAPREGDVFDFCPTRCEPGRALLSVKSVPPTQSDAKLVALGAATGRSGVALGLALVLAAAALVRGTVEPQRLPLILPAACVWAGMAALAGLWLWNPYGAWPEWYTFVWLPALVGVLVPAPRPWAVLGIATVAGTA